MNRDEDLEAAIVAKFAVVAPVLNERARRLWAAAESRSIGYGGDSVVSAATGMSRVTIRSGRREVEGGVEATTRVRRVGAGRPGIEKTNPGVKAALEQLVDPLTRGDPMSPLRWTCKSRAKLASTLSNDGWRVSSTTVGRMLHELGYSLQSVRKSREGESHPDRNEQFEHINATATSFLRRKQPALVHDFPGDAIGKAIPYGVYDMARNEAWVNVGRDHDTPQFAVASIRQWWKMMGSRAYPDAKQLFITADAGGSNGYRSLVWKHELQGLADEIRLSICVSHFPPGTSKWNKIEHRLFCHITQNWRGKPLRTFETIVDLIGTTSTAAGLRVKANLDKRKYRTGIEITKAQMSSLALRPHEFHGEWNYELQPRDLKV